LNNNDQIFSSFPVIELHREMRILAKCGKKSHGIVLFNVALDKL